MLDAAPHGDLNPAPARKTDRRPIRVLQGLIDIAGQAGLMASTLRSLGHHSESWVYGAHPFGYQNDRVLWPAGNPTGLWSRTSRARFLLEALTRFEYWHLHKGGSFLHDGRDLRLAKKLGVKIIMHYRGREIRPVIGMERLTDETKRRLEKQLEHADLVFVHDGELAELIKPLWPDPIVFPNIVAVTGTDEMERESAPRDSRLRVVHIPSAQQIKGTEYVRRAVEGLAKVVHYVELSGIPHREVLVCYRSSDLIIDQLLIGTFGNASLEGMALGKPVMCYLDERLKEYHPADLPIIPVDRENLRSMMLRAVEDRYWLADAGARGTAYVARYHSPSVVAELAIDYYRSIMRQA